MPGVRANVSLLDHFEILRKASHLGNSQVEGCGLCWMCCRVRPPCPRPTGKFQLPTLSEVVLGSNSAAQSQGSVRVHPPSFPQPAASPWQPASGPPDQAPRRNAPRGFLPALHRADTESLNICCEKCLAWRGWAGDGKRKGAPETGAPLGVFAVPAKRYTSPRSFRCHQPRRVGLSWASPGSPAASSLAGMSANGGPSGFTVMRAMRGSLETGSPRGRREGTGSAADDAASSPVSDPNSAAGGATSAAASSTIIDETWCAAGSGSEVPISIAVTNGWASGATAGATAVAMPTSGSSSFAA